MSQFSMLFGGYNDKEIIIVLLGNRKSRFNEVGLSWYNRMYESF